MLNIFNQQQLRSGPQLRYLLPFQFWQQLLEFNINLANINDLVIPEAISLLNSMESIENKQKQAFLKLVSHKVTFLQIDNFILSPKLKTDIYWKPISIQFFLILKRKIHFNFSLPLILLQDHSYPQNFLHLSQQLANFKVLKVLFCSFSQNHLFYGYIPQNTNIKLFITQLLVLFQYFYTQDTKITFLESNQFRNYNYQTCSFNENQKQQLMMIHGLKRYDQKQLQEKIKQDPEDLFVTCIQSSRAIRVSRNGQELTMADQDSLSLSDHTMSTGAQTPFTFAIEDLNWDFFRPQNYGLFGEKLHQQIEHMKEYARQAIYTDIIQVPVVIQQVMRSELEKLAEDIQQNVQKRKIYQKEMVKQGKEHLKQGKQSHHWLLIKDKECNSKELKEMINKNQQRTKQNGNNVVHFTLSLENN